MVLIIHFDLLIIIYFPFIYYSDISHISRMDPIGDVPLKEVGKWANKNLNVGRVSKQLLHWYTAYDKVL